MPGAEPGPPLDAELAQDAVPAVGAVVLLEPPLDLVVEPAVGGRAVGHVVVRAARMRSLGFIRHSVGMIRDW